jgi:hypothetical protein
MDRSLSDAVWERAGDACEYCRLCSAIVATPFEVDHVIAQQHGGKTEFENLALACLRCNKRKGPNLAGIDPDTGEMVRLFHPRKDEWSQHFAFAGSRIEGRTSIGRASVAVLAMNDGQVIMVREELLAAGVWPPT